MLPEISFNIYALIPFLTLLQGLVFSTLLILRGWHEERYADFWAAVVLVLLSLNGIPYMFGWLGVDFLWEKLTFLPWDGFWLALPPAIYLYLKSLTNQNWRFRWRSDGWHFGAYGLYFMFHLTVGLIGFGDKNFWTWWWREMRFSDHGVMLLSWGVQIYYFVLAFRLYKNYRAWTFEEFSNAEQIGYQWFRNFLILHFTLSLIGIVNDIYVNVFSSENGNTFYALMWLGYLCDTVLMYYLSISAFKQRRTRPIIFDEKNRKTSETPVLSAEKVIEISEVDTLLSEKIESQKNKNTLSEEELSAWKKKILTHFDTQKPYLMPELTLSDLAEQLKTNSSVLSLVINSGFDKNFNDFINAYRVEEFKQKMATPQYQHLTRLAVAFDCGFNSKATFNRAFKKLTGQNPSDF